MMTDIEPGKRVVYEGKSIHERHTHRVGKFRRSCAGAAFSTIYGGATLTYLQVWAYQVARGTVGVGDPLDFSKRLDNRWTVQTDVPCLAGGR